jgi:hypothetical protein
MTSQKVWGVWGSYIAVVAGVQHARSNFTQSAASTTRLVIMYAGTIQECLDSVADSPQCEKDAMRLASPLGAVYVIMLC